MASTLNFESFFPLLKWWILYLISKYFAIHIYDIDNITFEIDDKLAVFLYLQGFNSLRMNLD